MSNELNVGDLVDIERGVMSPGVFTRDDVYALELDRIFGRCWLFVAHESQVENPGDFLVSSMGEDPVIVARTRDGEVAVFLNLCRHRGMKICRAELGNARAFTCTYHGWTYDLEGKLTTIRHEDEYPADFDKANWGARVPAKVASYRGFIFATWADDAPDLVDYLGGAAQMLDSAIDRTVEGVEFVGGAHKWVIDCNWKMPSEQFATDMYHAATSHVSAAMVLGKDANPTASDFDRAGTQYVDSSGHGGGYFVDHEVNPQFWVPQEVREWLIDGAEMARDRLGDLGNKTSGHNTIFPNFSYLSGSNVFRVWHPRGPHKIEVWSWIVVDKGAPQEVKDAWVKGVARSFGPSGVFEQDDGENWVEVHKMYRGGIANETPLNYQMGLEAGTEDGPFNLQHARIFSDEAARNFYGRWAALLGSPTSTRRVHSAGQRGGIAQAAAGEQARSTETVTS